MAGVTAKDEIMAATGPEDNLVAVRTNVNSSEYRTAGNDWVVGTASVIPVEKLDYKDVDEQRRFTAQVLSQGPSGDILRDLISQRNICAKQVYMNKVCSDMPLRSTETDGDRQRHFTGLRFSYTYTNAKLADVD